MDRWQACRERGWRCQAGSVALVVVPRRCRADGCRLVLDQSRGLATICLRRPKGLHRLRGRFVDLFPRGCVPGRVGVVCGPITRPFCGLQAGCRLIYHPHLPLKVPQTPHRPNRNRYPAIHGHDEQPRRRHLARALQGASLRRPQPRRRAQLLGAMGRALRRLQQGRRGDRSKVPLGPLPQRAWRVDPAGPCAPAAARGPSGASYGGRRGTAAPSATLHGMWN